MGRRFKLRRKPARKKSMILKRPQEIELMREAGTLVAESFALLKANIKPGVRLNDLDKMVEAYIRSRGALPLYKNYQGNPPLHPPFLII